MEGKIIYYPVFHEDGKPGAERSGDVRQWVDKFMVPAGWASYDKAKANCCLVAAGDGRLMRVARTEAVLNSEMVIFGVNRGTLGFLLNPINDINQIPENFNQLELVRLKLIQGRFFLKTGDVVTCLAFNEVAIGDKIVDYVKFIITGSLTGFHNRVVRGSGLVVSTPQGTTGFVLNTGGSVLPLDTATWYVKGVASGPYPNDIVSPQKITIEVESRTPVHAYADGHSQEALDIYKAEVEPTDYYTTLAFVRGADFNARRTELARRVECGVM